MRERALCQLRGEALPLELAVGLRLLSRCLKSLLGHGLGRCADAGAEWETSLLATLEEVDKRPDKGDNEEDPVGLVSTK